MATIHSKFISGWEAIFAPSISEGQVISAYVDEPISPYVILGDNFLPASLALKSLFISRSLSNEDISSMSLSLLDYIGPNSLHSVALSINGILLSEGSDFYTHDNSICWDNCSLQNFGLTEGDIFNISLTFWVVL